MKYPENQATGDAGESLFAHNITAVLGWPCRLLDRDIGVDAQVEILDMKGNSTGRIVAFQIKSTREPQRYHAYVSGEQLTYFQKLQLPVFIVLVHLNAKKMFLHQVLADATYPPPTSKGNVRIDFDPEKDLFSSASRKRITTAANASALVHIRRHLNVVRDGIRQIRRTIATLDDSPNGQDFVDAIVQHRDWKNELLQARAVSRALRAGKRECDDVAAQLQAALSDLHDSFEGSYQDWNDNGQLTAFFEESGWRV